MTEVKIHKNEQFESCLRKFNSLVKKEGFLQEIRDRRYYKKPSEVRRLKRKWNKK